MKAAIGLTLLALGAVGAAAATRCPSPQGQQDTVSLIVVRNRAIAVADRTMGELPGSTTYCAACHDGTVATSMLGGPKMSHQAGVRPTDPGHPVDVLYPVAESGFVPVSTLDPRLRLENGRVTCATCHSGDATGRTLSISNDRSRLCLSCHVK